MKIKGIVDKLISDFGTRNPEKIAQELGMKIIYKEYEDMKGCYVNIRNVSCLIVNSRLNELQRTFILAHELGHAVLHAGQDIHFIREYTYFPMSRLEKQANLFACYILGIEPDDHNIKKLTA